MEILGTGGTGHLGRKWSRGFWRAGIASASLLDTRWGTMRSNGCGAISGPATHEGGSDARTGDDHRARQGPLECDEVVGRVQSWDPATRWTGSPAIRGGPLPPVKRSAGGPVMGSDGTVPTRIDLVQAQLVLKAT
jgi:hypothetical protein